MGNLKIANNFSKYARSYDKYADIQEKSARRLMEMAGDGDFCSILEIGCGTGNYTFMLRHKFKNARITALDISAEMIGVSQDKLEDGAVEFIIADAETAGLAQKFDLVTSNACFHWFQDMEKAILKYKGLLNEKGLIMFSAFGPLTFCELNDVLKEVFTDSAAAAAGFKHLSQIRHVLENNFEKVSVEEEIIEEDFKDLRELLAKIRYSGIRGEGLKSGVYMGRESLERLERAYLDKFGKIKATYQVFFCKGQC
jgi:malonyl-CoA O-methyltransferase